ncbi:MAG: SDR family oxidoreductase [Promethearchaeota archaeon]|nr:MAG: SDR family oxidoreductase [Candidatus Lokiarchaeota archaeon]
MRVKDKVCILTGAASGIGRATAKLFANEGAFLVISDIDENGLKETYDLLEKVEERVSFMKVDVREPKEVKKMIQYTIDKYGKIDVLIVNAGVVRVGPVDKFPDEDYELLIDVNLKGTFYTCKFAIPYFKKQRFGSIITLASVAAHIGQINHANYCSTKAGVLGFTKALALDMAPYNVRVNSVSPGATDTPMLQSDVAKQARDRGVDYEVVKKEFEEEGVLGRWAQPEEIATGILFLATEDASYMTGADLRIDGGWVAR